MDTEHTQGSLTKEAIRLAWPAVCESFFIALAGMVDTFMVSTLGANAVAAVGLTTQPKFLGLALFIAANVAISALVARRFGEKRQQAANEILVMTICFCIVAAVIISALTVGFADYQIHRDGALICGYTGVGPDAIVNRSAVKSPTRGQEVALDVLAAARPKKLYILLGTNTLTTLGASDRFLAYYGQMLDMLREALGEDCVIYVQSIPPVRPSAAAEKPGLASDVLRGVNEQLAQLAASKGCVYLDLWEALADGEGNLKEMLAAPDGVHLSAGNGYGAWVTYLRNHAKYSADNSWTMGSVYSAQ